MTDKSLNRNKGSWVALLPLMTFIIFYLVVSIIMGDFYKVPITVAFLASAIIAIVTTTGIPFSERIKLLCRGASTENMMLMVWIFIMAGAFCYSAKAIGCITSTVNLALTFLPAEMLLAGFFIAACFISISIGTSVGTIVALVPIASQMAEVTNSSVPLMTGVIVGGALFGDNLSFISDTTVVATQSQGCRMSDKFHANIHIVIPAAIFICILYILLGTNISSPEGSLTFSYLHVLPYLTVLILAACGVNVLYVLTAGIALTGIIGIGTGALNFFEWLNSLNQGIMSMSELIIVTMLAGSMVEIVRRNGGILYIVELATSHINSSRGAELAIALLITLVDFCTANNTIAIITAGPIAKQIAAEYHIAPRRTASILDTFSCFAQGIIPYGAQLLMAAGLASLTPVEIIPYLFYPYALGIVALLDIITRRFGRIKE